MDSSVPSGCPVAHDTKAAEVSDNAKNSAAQLKMNSSSGVDQCPISNEDRSSIGVCIAEGSDPIDKIEPTKVIDPRNNMPRVAEQNPWPGQKLKLSTDRIESVIPKSSFSPAHQGELARVSSSWVYPSEQQFFNAMKRKGWEPREEDMPIVLSIHNHVNDTAWTEILKYEEMHFDECEAGPRLVRFMGRPKDMSPKAFIRSMLGYSKPFDRHDWVVDRCGKEVRYIIDFFKGPPPLPETGKVVSMHLDARPALDSFEALYDRIKLKANENFKSIFPKTK